MPTFLFANQARIFMYYTVMGYQFDQDESYNSALDEVLGASTIVDDDAPQSTTMTTPTDTSVVNRLSREQTHHHFPRLQQQICNFRMRREKLVLPTMMMTTLMTKTVPNTATHLASTLNQEHTITAVLGLTNMANAMATQEEQILKEEDNDGAMDVQVNAAEGVDNIEELHQQLHNQVVDVDHQIHMLQGASDINTSTDSKTATDSSTE
jgi:hypothetical protein